MVNPFNAGINTVTNYKNRQKKTRITMKSVARNVIYEKRHKKHKKRAGSTLKCMHDILFDADAWEQRMEKHMISEGYKAEYVGKGNHDVYHRLRLQAL